MRTDVFPATQAQWIDQRLAEGDQGRAELRRFIMTVYAAPLRVYYLGTRERDLGDADDVVNGFFASRLDQPDYFHKWKQTGMRLRRWLMNGLCFYLKELRSRNRRDGRLGPMDEATIMVEQKPANDSERCFVVELVRQAMRLTASQCHEDGLDEHWRVFLQHHHHDQPFQTIAREVGVNRARAEVMCRTATRRFRLVVRELLARDGVPADEIDAEIEHLLERLS